MLLLAFSMIAADKYKEAVQPIVYIAEAAVETQQPRPVQIEVKINWTEERIKQEYKAAALRYDVSFEQMWAVVSTCENIPLNPLLQSQHPDPRGPNGREDSWGLSQIHLPSWPNVSREQAQDPAFAADFMAKRFSEGLAHRWTCWRKIYQ